MTTAHIVLPSNTWLTSSPTEADFTWGVHEPGTQGPPVAACVALGASLFQGPRQWAHGGDGWSILMPPLCLVSPPGSISASRSPWSRRAEAAPGSGPPGSFLVASQAAWVSWGLAKAFRLPPALRPGILSFCRAGDSCSAVQASARPLLLLPGKPLCGRWGGRAPATLTTVSETQAPPYPGLCPPRPLTPLCRLCVPLQLLFHGRLPAALT